MLEILSDIFAVLVLILGSVLLFQTVTSELDGLSLLVNLLVSSVIFVLSSYVFLLTMRKQHFRKK